VNIGNLLTDLTVWGIRILLREYFLEQGENGEQQVNDIHSKFKKDSDWTPPNGRDRFLDIYIFGVFRSQIRYHIGIK